MALQYIMSPKYNAKNFLLSNTIDIKAVENFDIFFEAFIHNTNSKPQVSSIVPQLFSVVFTSILTSENDSNNIYNKPVNNIYYFNNFY